MAEPRCTACGSVLSGSLAGLCPTCLMKAGLAEGDAHQETTAVIDSPPPPAAAPVVAPVPGHAFGGYQIIRQLGQGGMGSVYEAEEQHTGRRLALKVLNHSLDSHAARQRFFREGKLAASLNHPQTVYVFNAEEIQGAPVITMELVKGGTLQDRVRKDGPLPIADAVDAILQVIDGLEAAQALDVLHRDVKPANCFVDADGRVRIGDFGLSIDKQGRGDLHLTSSGVFLGTPTFASPEQLRGDELDARSDQYAVGVTLYYLLTGTVPFQANTMVQLVAKVLDRPAPDIRTLRPEITRELSAVVQRTLAKEPSRRYATYADLRAALVPFSSLQPEPATPMRRVIADCVDRTVWTALHGACFLALSFLGVRVVFNAMVPHPAMIALGVALIVLYYMLPEGLLGMTLGKRLLGVRVVRDGTRQPPGVLRAGLRTLLFHYVPVLPTLVFLLAFPEAWEEDGVNRLGTAGIGWLVVAGNATFAIMALLFVTMRQRNGYAGIHDLISGCRVVVRPAAPKRTPLPKLAESPDRPQPGKERIGPYHVLGPLGATAAGEWHLGYDTRLFRKVWLRVVPAGTPMVAPARQNVARPNRLRWLTGRRGPQENWDAYEAPSGQALPQLLDRPHDWSYARYWLIDLADELAAALKDGTIPPLLSLDQVWINADGRALLLDEPVLGLHPDEDPHVMAVHVHAITVHPGDVEPTKGFLHQVALATLHGRRIGAEKPGFTMPLPSYARPILEGLAKIQRPEVASAQIQAVLARPTHVSRLRRAMILAGCVAAPLLFGLFMVAVIIMARLTPKPAAELVDLRNALNWHSPVFEFLKPDEAETKALEVYLAGPLRERINDPATWADPYAKAQILASQQEAAKQVVARTPVPTEDEVKAALEIVGPRLKSQGGGLENERPEVVFAIMVTTTFVLCVMIPSLLAALLFRGGLLWYAVGITAVTRRGEPASRARLLWRSLVAWSPLFVGLLTLIVLGPIMDDLTVVVVLLSVIYLGVTIASALARRSWPDRVAGTWLVIR